MLPEIIDIPPLLQRIVKTEEMLSDLSMSNVEEVAREILALKWMEKKHFQAEIANEVLYLASIRPLGTQPIVKLISLIKAEHFLSIIEKYGRWELVEALRLEGLTNRELARPNVPNESLLSKTSDALMADNLENLGLIAADIQFDITAKLDITCNTIESDRYRKCLVLDMVSFSAFYSSIKCFKFLMMNGAELALEQFKYAVRGGNFEILHIYEQNNLLELSIAPVDALIYHRSNIFNWLNNFHVTSTFPSDFIQYYNTRAQLFVGTDKRPQLMDNFCSYNIYMNTTPNSKPIKYALFLGDEEYLDQIIKTHRCENEKDEGGYSPLFAACSDSKFELVRKFIESGSNPNDSAAGIIPLHFVALRGNIDLAKLLIELGSNANAVDNDGWAVINSACRSGNLEMVKLIVKHGGDVHHVTKNKLTTMHNAALSGSIPVIQYLLSKGVPISSLDCFDRTPLMSTTMKEAHDFIASIDPTYKPPPSHEMKGIENTPLRTKESGSSCRLA